jgi:hypothetical protein
VNKIIATPGSKLSVADVLGEFFGGSYSYMAPSGNLFFETLADVELCVFSNGDISLCGLGEFKKIFKNPIELRDFVKNYLKNKEN